MSALLRELGEFALGLSGDLSLTVWLLITLVVVLTGTILSVVARPVIDPVAVIVALEPGAAAVWMFVSAAAVPLLTMLLVYSLVGIPLAVLGVLAVALGAGLGYLAVAIVLGDRLTRAVGRPLHPAAAMLVGIALLRLVRLVPFVGAPIHSLAAWFGFGAVSLLSWRLLVSFHRRRMPDNEQFAGEQLIEWSVSGQVETPETLPPESQ